VSADEESKADIVAMSGLFGTTITYFPTVIKAFEQAGLRDKARMIGGALPQDDFFKCLQSAGFNTPKIIWLVVMLEPDMNFPCLL